MKKIGSIILFLGLFVSFYQVSFALENIFSSEYLGMEVFFDENGDLIYQTPEMEASKVVEADIRGSGLVDVSSDGKWVIFQKGINISLLNLVTHEVQQISLNLDPHWSWFNHQVKFSPSSQYLFYEIGRDGIGGIDICIYEINKIDFETINNELEKFNEEYDLNNLKHQCSYVSGKIGSLMDEGVILPLQQGSPLSVYDAVWSNDGHLEFSTSLGDEAERWSVNLENSAIEQIEGKSITTPPFSDMTMDDPDMKHILAGMDAGWLRGYSDGTVRLDESINRAEFTKLVILALDIAEQQPDPDELICIDVHQNKWYSNVFYTAKKLGAIQGYPYDGLPESLWPCKPAETINKVEALKVALELEYWNEKNATFIDVQYDDIKNESEWYAPYTSFARYNNLICTEDGNLYPDQPISRREMIRLVNSVSGMSHVWQVGGTYEGVRDACPNDLN